MNPSSGGDSHPVPGPELERHIVARLRSEGLIRSDSTKESDMKRIHLSWAVAATALLAVGLFLGRMPFGSAEPAAEAADTRKQFALMLYEDSNYQTPVAAETTDRVREYSAWARELAADGTVMGGEKLAETGLLLSTAESREMLVPGSDIGQLAGYFVIRAKDESDAASIAATCPHLKYGGRISLRRIET